MRLLASNNDKNKFNGTVYCMEITFHIADPTMIVLILIKG